MPYSKLLQHIQLSQTESKGNISKTQLGKLWLLAVKICCHQGRLLAEKCLLLKVAELCLKQIKK